MNLIKDSEGGGGEYGGLCEMGNTDHSYSFVVFLKMTGNAVFVMKISIM